MRWPRNSKALSVVMKEVPQICSWLWSIIAASQHQHLCVSNCCTNSLSYMHARGQSVGPSYIISRELLAFLRDFLYIPTIHSAGFLLDIFTRYYTSSYNHTHVLYILRNICTSHGTDMPSRGAGATVGGSVGKRVRRSPPIHPSLAPSHIHCPSFINL